MQTARCGSILKYCARHSATHESCLAWHPAELSQATQALAGCAIAGHGAPHADSVRINAKRPNDRRRRMMAGVMGGPNYGRT
jgi:hypothetical protein